MVEKTLSLDEPDIYILILTELTSPFDMSQCHIKDDNAILFKRKEMVQDGKSNTMGKMNEEYSLR